MSVLFGHSSKTAMFSRFLKVAIATSNWMNEVYNGGFSPEIIKKSLRERDRETERQRDRETERDRERGCRLLGSLLDAQNDIKRRKVLAINAPNKLKHLFLNKSVIISVKIKLFKTYITPIFYIISSYGNVRWRKCCILHFLHLATERSHNLKLHKILDLNSFVLTLIADSNAFV